MTPTMLRMEVLIGTTALPDTPVNRALVFVVSNRLGAMSPRFGNVPSPANRLVVGITARVDEPAHFSSADLSDCPDMTGQLSDWIERGIIRVTTDAAPGVSLTRANIEAFLEPV